jgi:hypothetical protein
MVFLLVGKLVVLTGLSLLQSATHKVEQVVPHSLHLSMGLGRDLPTVIQRGFCAGLGQYCSQGFDERDEIKLEWFRQFPEIFPKLDALCL